MTITLAPQTGARLKEVAIREGWDENALADALLAEVLEVASRDFEGMLSGIDKGRRAYAGGRSRPFSDYVADVMERRRQRDAAPASQGEPIAF